MIRKRGACCRECGARYQADPPRYCTACGRPLLAKKPRRRKVLLASVAATLAVLLLASGAFGIAVWLGSRSPSVPLPRTARACIESIPRAETYLTDGGKKLAAGRTEGLSVYSVDCRLDPLGATVSGTETILYTNRTGVQLEDIVLRVYANASEVKGDGNGATIDTVKVDGRAVSVTHSGSLSRIGLPSPLPPGGRALVSFKFVESLPAVSAGLGVEQLLGGVPDGGYGILGHARDIFNLGYFIPTVAGHGEDGWEAREVPAFGDTGCFEMSYYNVSLDVPRGYTVAAPGTLVGRRSSGGRERYDFRGGPLRDFSAQASPSYIKASAKVGQTTVNSYYTKSHSDGGEKVLGFAKGALQEYARRFGPYPYRTLNVCEAPLAGGAGGMEFTAQVQVAQMLYGLQPNAGGNGGGPVQELLESLTGGLIGDTLEFTVAHEVCHQWWGIVAGSDQIAHPWQDESLTNYCSVLYFRWLHGEAAAKKQVESQIMMNYSAARLMGAGEDAVVGAPVGSFADQAQYAAAVYSKGALFYRELEQSMGREAFEKSLQEYYSRYAFSESDPGQMMRCFYENSTDGAASAALHRRWICEMHADEDIASAGVPGMGMLEDLLELLPGGGLDLERLDELLDEYLPDGLDLDEMMKQLLPQGTAPVRPGPGTGPVLPI